MLLLWDPRTGDRNFLNTVQYNSPEGKEALSHLIHFAKENGLWEPKKTRATGWEAVHISQTQKLPLMYQHAPDAQPGEINAFAGRIICDLLQTMYRQDPTTKDKPVEVWGPERRSLLARVYVEVDCNDKANAQYLRQALEYLDNYGRNPEQMRVIATVSCASDRDPYRMSLLFQERHDGDWKTWMNGGLEFFPENAGNYKRDWDGIGWSVHS